MSESTLTQQGAQGAAAGLLAEQALGGGTQAGVEARAASAATRIGVEVEEVEQLPFDLSALDQEGLFINCDAKGFGMLDRRLDWSALGIKLPKTSVSFRPPHIGVIPDKYRLPLQRPAAQAHNALKRYGFRFRLTETIFHTPEYKWVPWQAFLAFEAEFNAARAALEEAKADALAHYDDILAEVRETFQKLGEDSARRISATGAMQFETDAERQEFIDRIVEGALNLVPSRSDIQNGLSLRFKPGVIHLGSEMLAEQRRAAEEKLELTKVAVETETVVSEARHRQGLQQASLLEAQERERLQTQHFEEELERERAAKDRIRNLKVEAAREALGDTLSPLMEGAEQLHLRVYEAAQQMLDTLRDKKFVPGATAKSARELAKWFKLMNFQNDQQLGDLLEELNGFASAKANTRRPGDISSVLGDIARATKRKATQAMQRNRFDALEV